MLLLPADSTILVCTRAPLVSLSEHNRTVRGVYELKGGRCIWSQKLALNSDGNMINCWSAYNLSMERTHQAIFLALMMATMSLAGCTDATVNVSDEDNDGVVDSLDVCPDTLAQTLQELHTNVVQLSGQEVYTHASFPTF